MASNSPAGSNGLLSAVGAADAPRTPEGPPPGLLARPVYMPPTTTEQAVGRERRRVTDRRRRLINRILDSTRPASAATQRRRPISRVAPLPLSRLLDEEPAAPQPLAPAPGDEPGPEPGPQPEPGPAPGPGSGAAGADSDAAATATDATATDATAADATAADAEVDTDEGSRNSTRHYMRIIASYRARLQQLTLLSSFRQMQLKSLQQYVRDLENSVTTLLQARDQSARACRDMRRRVAVAEDGCQSQALRHACTTSNLRAVNLRTTALETHIEDTIALLNETQQMVNEANEQADESERRGSCVVCLDARADTVVVACRHCVLCRACCEALLERASASQPARCTVCRETFDASGVMHIRLP